MDDGGWAGAEPAMGRARFRGPTIFTNAVTDVASRAYPSMSATTRFEENDDEVMVEVGSRGNSSDRAGDRLGR